MHLLYVISTLEGVTSINGLNSTRDILLLIDECINNVGNGYIFWKTVHC